VTDLNTAISVSKGWTYTKKCEFYSWVLYNEKNVRIDSGNDKPDYEHDANLYMALFEEMCKEGYANLDFNNNLNEYKVHFYTISEKRGGAISRTIGTAICLAYCKLKGIEVVG